jgi:hypothetical protein
MAPPAVKLQAIGVTVAEYGPRIVSDVAGPTVLSHLLRICRRVIEYILGSYFSGAQTSGYSTKLLLLAVVMHCRGRTTGYDACSVPV